MYLVVCGSLLKYAGKRSRLEVRAAVCEVPVSVNQDFRELIGREVRLERQRSALERAALIPGFNAFLQSLFGQMSGAPNSMR